MTETWSAPETWSVPETWAAEQWLSDDEALTLIQHSLGVSVGKAQNEMKTALDSNEVRMRSHVLWRVPVSGGIVNAEQTVYSWTLTQLNALLKFNEDFRPKCKCYHNKS